jgi:cell division protease FtsH
MEKNNENDNNSEMNTKPTKFKTRPDKRDLLKRRSPNSQIPPKGKGPNTAWPIGHRIAFILLLVILGFFLWKQMNPDNANYIKVSYTKFNCLLTDGKIKKVRIRDSILYGELKETVDLGAKDVKRVYSHIAVNIGAYDHAFIQEMDSKGVEVTIEPERTWVNMLLSTLPWIIIFAVWLFFLRQMQGGTSKSIFTFGKSRAKLMAENQSKTTFKDVAGIDEAKVEVQEIIDFLKDPEKFQRLGGKIPKGALIIGPPGTGKTLLARAVAGEAGVPFFSMSGSDFVEMFVGVGASRVRDLFEQGKNNAPCIIFIDEIDAVGRQRGAGIGGGHDEREQTLNQLLVEMDGFESNEGVILLAATNRPDVLDHALLRPGRFDRQIVVDWPDVKAREDILKVHVTKIKVSPDIKLVNIAKGTPGMTGADLANVVNEAALLAARQNKKNVEMVDFEEAKDKVMMGTARKSLVITEEEKRLTAYHEAGHVLVSKNVPNADPVHKVSIVARGRALGLTHFLPIDEKHNWSYTYCIGKLIVLLGGRAAEVIKFNDITNGAANDIENATNLARKMVCEWGMSKRLGPLTFGKKDNEIFLGREIATHKDYSEETAIAIDQEIRKYVEDAQQQAESIIRDNTAKLETLTSELLKKEILTGNEIDRILNNRHSSSKKRSRRRPKSWSQIKAPQSADKPNIIKKNDTRKPSVTIQSSQETYSENLKEDKAVITSVDYSAVPENHNVAADTQNLEHKEEITKQENPASSDNKTNSSSRSHSRRSKMIRLKIGGRRKTIKKMPAQKIRKIN